MSHSVPRKCQDVSKLFWDIKFWKIRTGQGLRESDWEEKENFSPETLGFRFHCSSVLFSLSSFPHSCPPQSIWSHPGMEMEFWTLSDSQQGVKINFQMSLNLAVCYPSTPLQQFLTWRDLGTPTMVKSPSGFLTYLSAGRISEFCPGSCFPNWLHGKPNTTRPKGFSSSWSAFSSTVREGPTGGLPREPALCRQISGYWLYKARSISWSEGLLMTQWS